MLEKIQQEMDKLTYFFLEQSWTFNRFSFRFVYKQIADQLKMKLAD